MNQQNADQEQNERHALINDIIDLRKEITGFEKVEDSMVFHAGTHNQNGQIISNGGRVLAVTSFGDSIQEATKKSYQNIAKLHFDTMYFRKDIEVQEFFH